MAQIAPTACVDASAELAGDVVVGPGCVIGAGVRIGPGCVLKANVMVCDGVEIGSDNRFFANVVIGEEPQMLRPESRSTELRIGDHNVFRENVTVHRGSSAGTGRTVIGSHCFLMAGSHVAHDCEVADHVILSNGSLLSGHVKIEERAWIGAISGIHQFTTIGRYAYIGGHSGVLRDVPPYVRAVGCYPLEIRGINTVGLQRAGIAASDIAALKRAYLRMYKRREGRSFDVELEAMLSEGSDNEYVSYFLESLRRSSQHRLGRYMELNRHSAAPSSEVQVEDSSSASDQSTAAIREG